MTSRTPGANPPAGPSRMLVIGCALMVIIPLLAGLL